jgi:hypothetical protein
MMGQSDDSAQHPGFSTFSEFPATCHRVCNSSRGMTLAYFPGKIKAEIRKIQYASIWLSSLPPLLRGAVGQEKDMKSV